VKSDFECFIKTKDSLEFAKMCGASKDDLRPTIETQKKNFSFAIIQEKAFCFAIVRNEDNKYIGSLRLYKINEIDKNAYLTIGLIEEFFSKGYGSEAIQCLLTFAFGKLQLHKVSLVVLDFNSRGIKCYENCGFREDGILRDNVLIDGCYKSEILISILESEFTDLVQYG